MEKDIAEQTYHCCSFFESVYCLDYLESEQSLRKTDDLPAYMTFEYVERRIKLTCTAKSVYVYGLGQRVPHGLRLWTCMEKRKKPDIGKDDRRGIEDFSFFE